LHGNNIGNVGAASLARALRKNSTLRDLHLGRNAISDRGALQFAEALKVNRTLWGLHLTENEIGHAGATVLARALLSNPALGELWLLKNKISEVGAQRLLRCLQKPGNLRRLGVTFYEDSNKNEPEVHDPSSPREKQTPRLMKDLGDEQVKDFVEFVQSNKKVKELHLKKHSLSEAGMLRVARGLQKCPHLEKLYLGGRDLGDGQILPPMFFYKKPKPKRVKQHGLIAWKNDVSVQPASNHQKSGPPGLPQDGPQSEDADSESDARSLPFSKVPSTLGLDHELASNFTEVFSASSTDEEKGEKEEKNEELNSSSLAQDDTDLHRNSTGKQKRGFFTKLFFPTAAAVKSEEDLRKLNEHRIDSTPKLSFEEVPDLPAISDTGSVCSSSDIPTVAENPDWKIMHFDDVPSELPVSDDEEEEGDEDFPLDLSQAPFGTSDDNPISSYHVAEARPTALTELLQDWTIHERTGPGDVPETPPASPVNPHMDWTILEEPRPGDLDYRAPGEQISPGQVSIDLEPKGDMVELGPDTQLDLAKEPLPRIKSRPEEVEIPEEVVSQLFQQPLPQLDHGQAFGEPAPVNRRRVIFL